MGSSPKVGKANSGGDVLRCKTRRRKAQTSPVHILFVFVGRLIAEEGMSAFRIVECDVIMHTVEELSFGFAVAVIQLFSLHVRKEGFADRVSIT